MKTKIFHSTLLVAMVVLLSSLVINVTCLYDYFGDIQKKQLQDELKLAAIGVEEKGVAYLEDLDDERYRLAWIAVDGDVLFDSGIPEKTMENHGDREEIKMALITGEGEASRYSVTQLKEMIYYAQKLRDGTVLRISGSRATIGMLLLGMVQPIAIVLLLAIILSVILADRVAGKIIAPLNKLDLEHPLDNDTYEELTPLLRRIYFQHTEIASNLRELKRRKENFNQITSSMKEGLVLLSEKGSILSFNPAASRIFHLEEDSVGSNLLELERNTAMEQALEECLVSGHYEIRCMRGKQEYQLDFSRIESDEQAVGVVLLVFDVTEQAQLERIRREFTGNVSHELKTPLQSIMGSAELIENGIVKQEDMPRFVGHIRTEAARLVKLIDDIIHLSRMDDGAQLHMEPVNLLHIVHEAVESINDVAQQKKIELRVQGEEVLIKGVPRLLFELVYNLCDNAVKYTNSGGRVEVLLEQNRDNVLLRVSDTGIGIPKDELTRVFERFYRVDKSHSKKSGGTGLGLSIVKHVAACHHAKLDLQSTLGKGTTIKVTFPKK